ncbi:MAG: GIY-YIG nuclease family protein [Candidatus Parcubacteria bacterium]|nr:GIY-YIG nuclease family protein [Candidatus Parcubacteria bacterium]
MYKEYHVYIVECSDKSYYTGVTNSVERRVWEHNNDKNTNHYTYSRRTVILKFVETYEDINDAIAREKQIKRWNRKKKEALIRQMYEELPDIARGRKEYMNKKFFK